MRRLYVYATLIVLAHAAVVFWHLLTHTHIDSPLVYDLAMVYAALVGFLPINALMLMWANFPKAGAWLPFSFLIMPLAIFGREHFLHLSPENIFQIAPGEWTSRFRVSAVLLLVHELLGSWVSLRILRQRVLTDHPTA